MNARRAFVRAAAGLGVLVAGAAPAQEAVDLGPAPISWSAGAAGRVSAVVCSPVDANLYFAAGADGGVWRSRDGGATWTPVTDHLPTTAIGALAMDPADDRVIYAGSGEGNHANHSRYGLGLYKSVDGGDSWTVIGAETFAGRCFTRLAIDPRDPRTLYAAITRAGGFPEVAAAKGHPGAEGPLGVFKSTDAGETWAHLAGGLPDVSATDLVIDPDEPGTVYAAIGRIFGDDANGVYKSGDAGATWSKLTDGLPATDVGRIAIALAPSRPSRLYALIAGAASSSGGDANTRGVYRSDDAGATWSRLAAAGSFQSTYGWYLCVAWVHPSDADTAVFGGLDLLRTRDAGRTFDYITSPHVDNHAVALDASGRLLVGCDGGVYRSTDLGDTWKSLNATLSTAQFYAGLSTHPDDANLIYGGNQDNGTNRRDGSGTRWTTITGGDGGWTRLDPSRPSRIFVESQGTGSLSRSDDGGDSFRFAGAGLDGRNCFLPPYLIDPSTSDRLIYGTERVWESLDAGGSWRAISDDLTAGNGAIRAIVMAPSDPRVVYVATNDGRVLRSDDGGRAFEVLLEDNPGWPRVTRELTVNPEDPRSVYLAGASFGRPKVRNSRDGGRTWADLTGDLPDTPVNVIECDTRCPTPVLYAGTDAGLYRSVNGGRAWTRYGPGFPGTAVIDLRLEHDRARVIAGTQGRGAWSVAILSPADCNADGRLDVNDFVCLQSLWRSRAAWGDFDGDGRFTVRDFLAFQAAFVKGCP